MPRIAYDDRDPAITFSNGRWIRVSGPGGYQYAGTRTGTLSDRATMSFNFEGTKVTVVGLINFIRNDTSWVGRTPVADFIIDDGPPTRFQPPPTSFDLHQHTFFESQALEDGPHHLRIVNIGVNSDLWIDVVYVERPERGGGEGGQGGEGSGGGEGGGEGEEEGPSSNPHPIPAPQEPEPPRTQGTETVTVNHPDSRPSSTAPQVASSVDSDSLVSSSIVAGTSSNQTIFETQVKTILRSQVVETGATETGIPEAGDGSSNPGGTGSTPRVSAGAVVGGVLGGLAFLLLLAFVTVLLRRRRVRKGYIFNGRGRLEDDSEVSPPEYNSITSPFVEVLSPHRGPIFVSKSPPR
ncbi:hypothetical protein CC1G_04115 [Coprinopsis cinerea okayama7|uniref:Uncharacterized protein n=1 Tax=Coprinopsis cinerea (strain Okayama-7 / 130 / ATCC MYA-4618 / FGSC 9003) TaxID=240176 RepID=A8NW15_COPC7|nr:hypothetical protein CC1G_04115 [Coprinopsis cinerea okayama7\|eukprot:XP_001836802.2 hypothetical protein CC1G_04115 [Coprinopsis cinerea okayama7\